MIHMRRTHQKNHILGHSMKTCLGMFGEGINRKLWHFQRSKLFVIAINSGTGRTSLSEQYLIFVILASQAVNVKQAQPNLAQARVYQESAANSTAHVLYAVPSHHMRIFLRDVKLCITI